MCRINGVIDKRNEIDVADVIRMRDAMERGGPDNAGLYENKPKGLYLGHRRLSIIDLSVSGNQPMYNHDKNIIIVFNGEIYNYQDLRNQLLSLGLKFETQSDTEVIIYAYQTWGLNCFSFFRGMFALAIYDKKRQELILARDHAGIKPLYYFSDGQSLYFASEVRSFKKLKPHWPENPEWKTYFLTYGYLPSNITTLKNVFSLDKGSYLVFNVDTLECKKGNFDNDLYTESVTSFDEAKHNIRFYLEKSVQRHLIADAPIGLFLSGGIDSSLLTLIASKFKTDLHTLSITFNENNYSEKKYQELVSKKVNSKHKSFLLTKDIFVESLPDILQAMDQPSSDGINSYFISKFAKEAGLKAVLSGLGADELFGGYPSFRRDKLLNRLKIIPSFFLGASGMHSKDKIKKINFIRHKNVIGDYLFNRGYFIPSETARLLNLNENEVTSHIYSLPMPSFINTISDGNKTAFMETNLYMEGQLLKDTDFMSMWHSIEVRVPFLDYDLIKYVQTIKSDLKFGNKQGKFLLIESFSDLLPQEIWNRKKQGFTFPFDIWMKDNLDHFMGGKHNQNLNKRFSEGKLSWSRYWTYLVSQSFTV